MHKRKEGHQRTAYWRWAEAVSRVSHDDGETSFETKLNLIETSINFLTPQQKRVFYLQRFEGMNLKEIAAKLQLSRLTVDTHSKVGLKRVRMYTRKLMEIEI